MAGNSTDSLFAVVSTQTVNVTDTSAQSAAIASGIHHVRLVSTSNCHYLIGANPTATTSSVYLPANVIEKIRINQGEKIAIIRNSGDGVAHITSLSK
jgi:hypothetical protein|tara:strand:- start:469 stop:759 length:291 start_codon:yes stop_codon:yes gene_type:complete